MIRDGEILQTAIPVQTDAAGADSPKRHRNLRGFIAGEGALRTAAEKFLQRIRNLLANRTIRYAQLRRNRPDSMGRHRGSQGRRRRIDQKLSAGGLLLHGGEVRSIAGGLITKTNKIEPCLEPDQDA